VPGSSSPGSWPAGSEPFWAAARPITLERMNGHGRLYAPTAAHPRRLVWLRGRQIAVRRTPNKAERSHPSTGTPSPWPTRRRVRLTCSAAALVSSPLQEYWSSACCRSSTACRAKTGLIRLWIPLATRSPLSRTTPVSPARPTRWPIAGSSYLRPPCPPRFSVRAGGSRAAARRGIGSFRAPTRTARGATDPVLQ
jgi:hypothetical protein